MFNLPMYVCKNARIILSNIVQSKRISHCVNISLHVVLNAPNFSPVFNLNMGSTAGLSSFSARMILDRSGSRVGIHRASFAGFILDLINC
jgi:hypothetical protein